MNILILNGPNMNLLGLREPEIYGAETYRNLCDRISAHAASVGCDVSFYQSNHEGDLIDRIQDAYGVFDGIVFNPAAYTHTSVALLDALNAVRIPTAEVHVSAVSKRDAFRQVDLIRTACCVYVEGKGTDGYLLALDALMDKLSVTD